MHGQPTAREEQEVTPSLKNSVFEDLRLQYA